ncbi:glycosyltransferase family 4 protein [Streptosporangium soli]|nr:glycosyltransferase family 4 protein [Streptosporangium sp. KLBMP 9127]
MSGRSGGTAGPERVLLAAPGELSDSRGGAPMRWRALHAALSAHATIDYLPVTCAAPGRTCPHRAGSTRQARDDPFAKSYCPVQSDDLLARVTAGKPDLVISSELRLHRYAERIRRLTGVPVVDDMHNVEFALRRELESERLSERYTPEHAQQVFDVEEKVLAEAAGVWVCSERDRELLLSLHGSRHADLVRVASNAIPAPAVLAAAGGIESVVFTGRLGYEPNSQAVRLLIEEIVPRLRRAHPGLPVVIAGARCPEWVLRAAGTTPGLRVIADPPDLSEVIRRGVMVVPLRVGGGTRFKVLEAFALGAPVVSTAKGVEGLDLADGCHYLRAERPEEFVEAIGRILADGGLAARLRAGGHEHLRRRFSYEALTGQVGAALAALRGAS